MTICVYYKDVLSSDTLISAGTNIVSISAIKIGMIYEDVESGLRSLNPASLKYPKEFAMYSSAGACSVNNRFLRWFINAEHPLVDHESVTEEDREEYQEELEFQAMIIFKDHDIVRTYSSDYYYNYFVDQTKESLCSIGCGSPAALAINNYDENATSTDIVKAVINTDVYCGGNINTLSFSEKDPAYSISSPIKSKWKFW